MKCVLCKIGSTRKGKVTIMLDRKNSLVIIREVPAHICTNCGHYYLDSPVTKQVLTISREVRKKKAELEITKYQGEMIAA